MEKKKKGYVVVEMTLQQMEDKAHANQDTYNRIKLYEYHINRDELSEKQKEVQKQSRWYTERNTDIRFGEDTYYKAVQNVAQEKISNGCKENLINEIQNGVMNTKVRAVATIEPCTDDRSVVEVDMELGEGNNRYENIYEYTKDIKEFEERIKEVKYNNSFGNQKNEYVYLENFSVGMYSYAFNDVSDIVRKLIKKYIRNELTYCLKNGKVIVPDEYLAKGKEGIEEWRNIKSSNNKNNSMEKRLLKQVFADKKDMAFKSMEQIVSKVSSTNYDWSIPCITVDGRWNKTKIRKLITNLADTKDRQKFIDLPEDEMIKKFKDYWKDELMKIYKEIDNMEIEK